MRTEGQFLLGNAIWLAKESLKKLKHTGLVRDYVKEFTVGANRVVEASCEGLTSDNSSSRWLVDFRVADAFPSESKKFKEGKNSHSLRDGGKKNSRQNKAKQGNP
ncbi:hypothetical protein WN943_029252 [Citrus x changshan-huyou]